MKRLSGAQSTARRPSNSIVIDESQDKSEHKIAYTPAECRRWMAEVGFCGMQAMRLDAGHIYTDVMGDEERILAERMWNQFVCASRHSAIGYSDPDLVGLQRGRGRTCGLTVSEWKFSSFSLRLFKIADISLHAPTARTFASISGSSARRQLFHARPCRSDGARPGRPPKDRK